MLLILTAIDTNYQLREFACPINQLEVGFDLLNDIVARGDTLINAYIVDDHQSTSLPIEAFDGTHFLTALQELRQEWLSILHEPPLAISQPSGSLRSWQQQRVRRYEARLTIVKRTLDRLQAIQQRAQNTGHDTAAPSAVQAHYADLIERCKVRLIKSQLLYQVALDQLNPTDD